MARSITVIPVKQISTAESGTAQSVQKLKMAAYCRVSTDQEEQLLSYENQVNYYTNYISENPLYEYAGTYADEGISGTNTKKRDEFNRMIADSRAGKIDMIITKSISRFARNTLDCLNYVRELKDLGIGIIFEKENINTLDAKGEVLLAILSSLAQDESRSISENCTWGIRRRFETGKHKMSTAIPIFHTFPFKNPLDVIGCFSVHEFLIQPNHNRLLCPIDYQRPRVIRIVAKKTLCTHFVLSCLKPSADSPCAVL